MRKRATVSAGTNSESHRSMQCGIKGKGGGATQAKPCAPCRKTSHLERSLARTPEIERVARMHQLAALRRSAG
eukprot:1161776-Pelagomonas_calceolata.AAC.6